MEFYGATIDPGVNIARAVWINHELIDISTFKLIGKTDEDKIRYIHTNYHDPWSHLHIIIEDSHFYGDVTSCASAASGALMTLTKIIGALTYYYSYTRVELVKPQVWKGQLNNKQLRIILQKKFNFIARNDHEANAYGLGLWKQGLL